MYKEITSKQFQMSSSFQPTKERLKHRNQHIKNFYDFQKRFKEGTGNESRLSRKSPGKEGMSSKMSLFKQSPTNASMSSLAGQQSPSNSCLLNVKVRNMNRSKEFQDYCLEMSKKRESSLLAKKPSL